MPNAKTVPSSNNQNNANPSETRPQMELIQRVEIIDWRTLSTPETISETISLWNEYVNTLREYQNRLREDLANHQDPNPNDELLRFSEDDIDSNIDSDSDSDNDLPGLNDDV